MRMELRQATTLSPSVVIQTPAKLNLFLEILARRPDGYHELDTLMAAISIHDTLSFEVTFDGAVQLDCQWSDGFESRRRTWKSQGDWRAATWRRVASEGELPPASTPWEPLPRSEENLVVRALQRLREITGTPLGARVRLTKRIPSAAGLGGASSDAAAAIVAANVAWKLHWPSDRLAEFAAELGSDIPFFFRGGTATCRGRGEQIEPLARMPVLDFVVVRPPEGLSTPRVFRQCHPAAIPRQSRELVEAWRKGNRRRVGALLHNGLQEPARQLSPAIARLQSAFDVCHVLGHQMSGSGTSYFGLCHHARHARQVAGRLRSQGLGAVYCASTECSFVSGARQTSGP